MAKVRVRVSAAIFAKKGDINLEADTLEDALRKVAEQFDEKMRTRIFDQEGEINRFMDIFVNGTNISLLSGPDTLLRDGDTVTVLQVVSGG